MRRKVGAGPVSQLSMTVIRKGTNEKQENPLQNET